MHDFKDVTYTRMQFVKACPVMAVAKRVMFESNDRSRGVDIANECSGIKLNDQFLEIMDKL